METQNLYVQDSSVSMKNSDESAGSPGPKIRRGGKTALTFGQFKERTKAYLNTVEGQMGGRMRDGGSCGVSRTATPGSRSPDPDNWEIRESEQPSESELIIRKIISQRISLHPTPVPDLSLSDFKPLIQEYKASQIELKLQQDRSKKAVKRRTLAKLRRQKLTINPNFDVEFSQAETPGVSGRVRNMLEKEADFNDTLMGPGGSFSKLSGPSVSDDTLGDLFPLLPTVRPPQIPSKPVSRLTRNPTVSVGTERGRARSHY